MPGSFARADSIVVNGHGHDPLTGNGTYFETTFAPKKKHVLRLINGSGGTHFIFSIDNHTMTVIENDLVPIEPYNTTALSIGIGQRYMVVVEADQEPGDYWIRTHPATGCNGFNATLPCNGVFSATCSPFNVTTGIIRYNATSGSPSPPGPRPPPENTKPLPTSRPWGYTHNCADEPYERLRPVVPWTIDHHPQNEITQGRFGAAHQNVNSSEETGGYHHWMLTPDFLWLDFGNPTILNVEDEKYEWNPNFRIVEGERKLHVKPSPPLLRTPPGRCWIVDNFVGTVCWNMLNADCTVCSCSAKQKDNFESGYAFMIIEASNATSIPLPGKPGDVSVLNRKSNAFLNSINKYYSLVRSGVSQVLIDLIDHPMIVSHPLHWHGMDVVVLAQSNTTFDPVNSYKTFNFVNPVRRDVVLLPAGGYIAIAFRPDNPGAWLVHCHIAW